MLKSLTNLSLTIQRNQFVSLVLSPYLDWVPQMKLLNKHWARQHICCGVASRIMVSLIIHLYILGYLPWVLVWGMTLWCWVLSDVMAHPNCIATDTELFTILCEIPFDHLISSISSHNILWVLPPHCMPSTNLSSSSIGLFYSDGEIKKITKRYCD